MVGDIIQAISVIAVAIIGWLAERERKANRKEREEMENRAKVRAEEERLSMTMQNANLKLSTVIAKKVMNQHTNGDVEEAFEAATNAAAEYSGFINKIASEQVTKI